MQGRAKVTRVGRARRWAGILGLGGALAVLAALLVGLSIRAGSRSASSRALDEPVELHPTGDFAHPAGFPMPERVGPFQRVAVTQYDAAGTDVSAGYVRVPDGEARPLYATVYVYPAQGGDLDRYFDGLLRDLGALHRGATPEFRKNILLADRYVGRYAVFGYEEPFGGSTESIPLRSYVVVYGWQGWWVKWRVTTPAPVTPERMREIVELTESLLPPDIAPGDERPSTEGGEGEDRLTGAFSPATGEAGDWGRSGVSFVTSSAPVPVWAPRTSSRARIWCWTPSGASTRPSPSPRWSGDAPASAATWGSTATARLRAATRARFSSRRLDLQAPNRSSATATIGMPTSETGTEAKRARTDPTSFSAAIAALASRTYFTAPGPGAGRRCAGPQRAGGGFPPWTPRPRGQARRRRPQRAWQRPARRSSEPRS
jgi:hypothetical protein